MFALVIICNFCIVDILLRQPLIAVTITWESLCLILYANYLITFNVLCLYMEMSCSHQICNSVLNRVIRQLYAVYFTCIISAEYEMII